MSGREFEDISIPKWRLAVNAEGRNADAKTYRVYSSLTEFVLVDAPNATEAAVKSNLQKIVMIRIGAKDDMTMLDRSMLAAAVLPTVL